MKYAIVEGGVVVNIAEASEALAPNWFASDTARIGYTYADGVFSPPVVPLADAKAERLSALADARYAAEIAGVTVDGTSIPTDRDSVALLDRKARALDDGDLSSNPALKWPDGTWAVLTPAQIRAAKAAANAHVQAVFSREKSIADAINAAATTAEVAAIELDFTSLSQDQRVGTPAMVAATSFGVSGGAITNMNTTGGFSGGAYLKTGAFLLFLGRDLGSTNYIVQVQDGGAIGSVTSTNKFSSMFIANFTDGGGTPVDPDEVKITVTQPRG